MTAKEPCQRLEPTQEQLREMAEVIGTDDFGVLPPDGEMRDIYRLVAGWVLEAAARSCEQELDAYADEAAAVVRALKP